MVFRMTIVLTYGLLTRPVTRDTFLRLRFLLFIVIIKALNILTLGLEFNYGHFLSQDIFLAKALLTYQLKMSNAEVV